MTDAQWQVTGLKRGVSRYPNYDAAVLGFRNYWYPVMRSSELGRKPKAMTLFGEKIMFFRDQGRACALEDIKRRHDGLEVDGEMILAIPGATTPPDSWIIKSSVRAWEAVAGRPHAPRPGTSGATDANILRGRGIPTARLGMPPPRSPPYENTFSMGVVELDGMVELTKCLVRIAIDTCGRSRADVGLA